MFLILYQPSDAVMVLNVIVEVENNFIQGLSEIDDFLISEKRFSYFFMAIAGISLV